VRRVIGEIQGEIDRDVGTTQNNSPEGRPGWVCLLAEREREVVNANLVFAPIGVDSYFCLASPPTPERYIRFSQVPAIDRVFFGRQARYLFFAHKKAVFEDENLFFFSRSGV